MCVCVCTSVRRRRRRDCTAMYNRRKGHLNPVHFNYRPNVLNITVVMGGGGCGEGRGVVREGVVREGGEGRGGGVRECGDIHITDVAMCVHVYYQTRKMHIYIYK